MDAMKRCQNLSYFSKWGPSFPAFVISLDLFYLKEQVSIFWESMVVARDHAVASASKAEEGALERVNIQ